MTFSKDAMRHVHERAENTDFSQRLITGNLTPKQWSIFLINRYATYSALEFQIENKQLIPQGIKSIYRSKKIIDDMVSLHLEYDEAINVPDYSWLTKSSATYSANVEKMESDELIAHMYVRHFGDIYGGQLIAKNAPITFESYQFKNAPYLVKYIRDMLTSDHEKFAMECFEFIIKEYRELEDKMLLV